MLFRSDTIAWTKLVSLRQNLSGEELQLKIAVYTKRSQILSKWRANEYSCVGSKRTIMRNTWRYACLNVFHATLIYEVHVALYVALHP